MEKTTLYVVPTPIGNLGDISQRALEVLAGVDIIACEDTRRTRNLLNHFNIKNKLVSYEKFSEAKKTETIINHLENGLNVALVSDCGTPLISDPGAILVQRARNEGFRVVGLPGPCAVVTALSASGFEGAFRFVGFFPREKSVAGRLLARIAVTDDITIFYESPRRIASTLSELSKVSGKRQVCVAREISKIYEDYLTGDAQSVLSQIEGLDAIGELTVLVSGCEKTEDVDEETVRERADLLLKKGYSRKDALAVLSTECGIKRNDLYRMLLDFES